MGIIQKVVGISFRPCSNTKIKKGSEVKLIHDDENAYSSKAIKIMFEDDQLGYIGEKGNELHNQIFNSLPLKGKVKVMARLEEGEEFSKFKVGEITHLEIELDLPSVVDDKLVQSFNEDVQVMFDSTSHRYTYEGREFISATNYIKRWQKEFDKGFISGLVAKSLGTIQEDVLDMWNSGGNISADFGTVIHNALEHYERFKKLGKIMQDKKDLPFNKALPSHPALRKIVEEFYEQELQEGEVNVEVLVTNVELGLCGFIDRLLILDREKKICRVQDYKVNIGSEDVQKDKYLGQMADLPKTKISKYQMQLSFYARLLELAGWEVVALDVYIYEDKWVHHELPIIKLDF